MMNNHDQIEPEVIRVETLSYVFHKQDQETEA